TPVAVPRRTGDEQTIAGHHAPGDGEPELAARSGGNDSQGRWCSRSSQQRRERDRRWFYSSTLLPCMQIIRLLYSTRSHPFREARGAALSQQHHASLAGGKDEPQPAPDSPQSRTGTVFPVPRETSTRLPV